MKKMGDIIRNIIGIFFIIIGVCGFLVTEDKIFGVLLTLFGISFLPIIYMKISVLNKNKKVAVIIPIVIFILTIIIVPTPVSDKNNNNNNNETNVIETKEETILLESLEFEETEIEIDVKEIKSILLKIKPADANIEDMKINSTNYEILKVEKDKRISQKNTIYVNIKPITEGTCEVYAKANKIESNRIKVTIVDNERIEREKQEKEEQARKEMEEQARREAEEQARKEAEERAKKAEAQSQIKQPSTTTTQKADKNQNTKQTTSNPTKGATIYITPTGKRYHYSSACGGKNSTATSLEDAKARGLTPCKKCAQ